MSEKELMLSESMQKLEIEWIPVPSVKICDSNLPISLNPFYKRRRSKSLSSSTSGETPCTCNRRRSLVKNPQTFKKSTSAKKPIRESVLKFVKESHITECNSGPIRKSVTESSCKNIRKPFAKNDSSPDFKSIVDGCEQLKIDSEKVYSFPKQTFRERTPTESLQRRSDSQSSSSSCSQQAMARMSLNPPCDVTMDELASYFETFVHIPKKMSSMAEMMYI